MESDLETVKNYLSRIVRRESESLSVFDFMDTAGDRPKIFTAQARTISRYTTDSGERQRYTSQAQEGDFIHCYEILADAGDSKGESVFKSKTLAEKEAKRLTKEAKKITDAHWKEQDSKLESEWLEQLRAAGINQDK